MGKEQSEKTTTPEIPVIEVTLTVDEYIVPNDVAIKNLLEEYGLYGTEYLYHAFKIGNLDKFLTVGTDYSPRAGNIIYCCMLQEDINSSDMIIHDGDGKTIVDYLNEKATKLDEGLWVAGLAIYDAKKIEMIGSIGKFKNPDDKKNALVTVLSVALI